MTTSPAYCSTEPPNAVMPARLLEEGGEEGLQTLRIVAGSQLGRADKAGEATVMALRSLKAGPDLDPARLRLGD